MTYDIINKDFKAGNHNVMKDLKDFSESCSFAEHQNFKFC